MYTRRKGLDFFLVVLVLAGASVLLFGAVRLSRRPPPALLCSGKPCNVILIVADTISEKHLGLYGYERDTSPFIDEFFGENGIVFQNARSNAAWTLPSFASFYTSQLPSEIKVMIWSDKLSERVPTFADILRRHDVKMTAFFQGWLQIFEKDWGIAQRFKENERFRVEENLQFLFASEWIQQYSEEAESEKPFFMLLHTFITHEPYDPPPQYRALFGGESDYKGPVTFKELLSARNASAEEQERFRRQYDQEIRYLDDQLKEFFAKLPKEVLERSVIILTADHGEAFGEHKRYFGHGTPYEEVLRIPFLMRIPGISPRKVMHTISLLDLAPTILSIMGFETPRSFRGKSLLPLIYGAESPQRVILSEYTDKNQSFEIIYDPTFSPAPRILDGTRYGVAAYLGGWKLIKHAAGTFELYNLGMDSGERKNLFSLRHDLSESEKQIVNHLLIATDAPPLFCEKTVRPLRWACVNAVRIAAPILW